MKPIIHTIKLSNTAQEKISVAKITPTITFTERDSVDTPPVITDYARAMTIFIKNSNELVRIPANPLDYAKRRDSQHLSLLADLNTSADKSRAISISKNDPDLRPRYMFTHSYTETDTANIDGSEKFHMIINGRKWKNGITCYYLYTHPIAIDNVNRADKPAFSHDSIHLFDLLSEDYSA